MGAKALAEKEKKGALSKAVLMNGLVRFRKKSSASR